MIIIYQFIYAPRFLCWKMVATIQGLLRFVGPLTFLLVLAERLSLIRQQRAEAAKKREEEKAGMSLLSYVSFSSHQYPYCTLNFDIFQNLQPKNRRRQKLANETPWKWEEKPSFLGGWKKISFADLKYHLLFLSNLHGKHRTPIRCKLSYCTLFTKIRTSPKTIESFIISVARLICIHHGQAVLALLWHHQT